MQLNMPARIEMSEVRAQPGSAGLGDHFLDRKFGTIEATGRTASDENLDRPDHAPAAEDRIRLPSPEQDLIDIVVKYQAASLAVEPAQGKARSLGESVANAVGMAETLALDDFNRTRFGRRNAKVQAVIVKGGHLVSQVPSYAFAAPMATNAAPKVVT